MNTPEVLKQPLVFGNLCQITALKRLSKEAENNGPGKYLVSVEYYGEHEEEVEADSKEEAEAMVMKSLKNSSLFIADMDLDITVKKITEDSDEE